MPKQSAPRNSIIKADLYAKRFNRGHVSDRKNKKAPKISRNKLSHGVGDL